jgi:hypothetical protein
MVSSTIFIVVMTISMGSIYSVIEGNRKSQSMRSIMDNLNITLESMTRVMRFGYLYHCDSDQLTNPVVLTLPSDCPDMANGASSISLYSSSGTNYIYKLESGRITRYVGGSATPSYLTSSDVTIQSLTFYVYGSAKYSGLNFAQPMIVIIIKGYVGTKPTIKSTFAIQTAVSQRLFDTQ